ncbi:transcription regulator [Aspergillus bertholletiae]|uniref:Transcription regulator n=1 Tax=Aspergillus bertholletiae TaxID=1226010 RepID=A0A5N7AMD0_9EURO|nr:transcription regulator [Aspergillus bertholletiae]
MFQSLTAHLKTHNPTTYHSATTHPFLLAAGKGTLSKSTLSKWLSQDRLYAQSYVRFIGLLLSKCQLPHTLSPEQTREQRIVAVLIDALVNIQREIGFFEEVAREYGLDLAVVPEGEEKFGPAMVTQAYIDLFMSAGSPGVTLLEGLVVLWATEICYLESWEGAKAVMKDGGDRDLDGGALRERFIPNWTSVEFREFVEGIAQVVDALASTVKDGEKEELVTRCERWWRQVKWLEERFWPDVPQE